MTQPIHQTDASGRRQNGRRSAVRKTAFLLMTLVTTDVSGSRSQRRATRQEHAGLVTTEKVGRDRTCNIGPRRLEEETAWIERYRQLWDERFDELDKVVEELKRKEKINGRKKRE